MPKALSMDNAGYFEELIKNFRILQIILARYKQQHSSAESIEELIKQLNDCDLLFRDIYGNGDCEMLVSNFQKLELYDQLELAIDYFKEYKNRNEFITNIINQVNTCITFYSKKAAAMVDGAKEKFENLEIGMNELKKDEYNVPPGWKGYKYIEQFSQMADDDRRKNTEVLAELKALLEGQDFFSID